MFVFARDWRLALPLLFGPTLRCRRFALRDCLLTFNFGNERTQRADIVTRLLGERSLETFLPPLFDLRGKKKRVYIYESHKYLNSKKLSSLTIDSSEIVVTFPRFESDFESDNFFVVSSLLWILQLFRFTTWNSSYVEHASHDK